jgi:hypothetical protein
MTRLAFAFVALAAATLPAHAQRNAVSATLSPEAAGEAFKQAIAAVCVPAVSGSGVSSLAPAREGKVQPTQDVEMRRQSGAAPDETVWDVADARGVVTVKEKAGRCVVSVYGPPVAATLSDATLALLVRGFEAHVGTAGGFTQTLSKTSDGRRVTVQLTGAEPGSPGNQSQFSVVTATVFAVQ